MKRITLISFVLLIAAFAWIAGCSDDTNTTTGSTGKVTGDPTDPKLTSFDAGSDISGDMTEIMLSLLGDHVDSAKSRSISPSTGLREYRPLILADSVMVIYHPDSKYWYFYYSTADTVTIGSVVDSFNLVYTDSLQFLQSDTAVQYPSDTTLLTGLKQGASLSITAQSSVASVTATQLVDVTGPFFTTGIVFFDGRQTVTARFSDLISLPDTTMPLCSISVDLSSDFSQVEIDMNDTLNAEICPLSGNLNDSATLAVSCVGNTSLLFNETWTAALTFFGDSTHVVVENSEIRWESTEMCPDTATVASPEIEQLLSVMRR